MNARKIFWLVVGVVVCLAMMALADGRLQYYDRMFIAYISFHAVVISMPMLIFYGIPGWRFDRVTKLLLLSIAVGSVGSIVVKYSSDEQFASGGIGVVLTLLFLVAAFFQLRELPVRARWVRGGVLVLILSLFPLAFFAGYYFDEFRSRNAPSALSCPSDERFCEVEEVRKPVLYLYSTKPETITVRFDQPMDFVATYPEYPATGWQVKAYPDSRIIDLRDGQEYSYLFWESNEPAKSCPGNRGFLVKGSELRPFLRDTLSQIGLTPREYNEFVVYWYPVLQKHQFLHLCFITDEYAAQSPLTITPKPDSLLRLHMLYREVDANAVIAPQKLPHFERRGFAAVEWGGSEAGVAGVVR